MRDLIWRPAQFFETRGDDVCCTLCPRLCHLSDGQAGMCHVRRAKDGILETAAYAYAIRHIDPVERKPFYHFRPGTQALTLAPPGCTFTCQYCQNYRVSQFGRVEGAIGEIVPADPQELAAYAAERRLAIAFSYTEPVLATELTLDLSDLCAAHKVPILWKTNGFITSDALHAVAPALTAVNVDMKDADSERHRRLTGAAPQATFDTIAWLVKSGVWVEVSTPVIPGFNDDQCTLNSIAHTICDISPDIPWHLLRFNPDYKFDQFKPTSPQRLSEAVAIGRAAGLHFVYVERALGAEGRSTSCLECGASLIERGIWSCERNDLTGGACKQCGYSLPGRWDTFQEDQDDTL